MWGGAPCRPEESMLPSVVKVKDCSCWWWLFVFLLSLLFFLPPEGKQDETSSGKMFYSDIFLHMLLFGNSISAPSPPTAPKGPITDGHTGQQKPQDYATWQRPFCGSTFVLAWPQMCGRRTLPAAMGTSMAPNLSQSSLKGPGRMSSTSQAFYSRRSEVPGRKTRTDSSL